MKVVRAGLIVGPYATGVTDKEIPIYSGTTGTLATTSGIGIGLSTALQITPTASNTNLLLDGNGTGVVQHNTGSNSYQMPKTRATSGLPGPHVLACAPASGDCSWTNIGSLLVPSWQNTYDYSGSPNYFDLKGTNGGLNIRDGSTPVGTFLFAITDTSATIFYFSVFDTGVVASTMTVSNLTAGSVVFAGASGLLSEDNSKFFWDDTNKRLGIGVGASTNTITIGGASYGSLLTLNSEGTTDLLNATIHRHSNTAGFGGYMGFVRSRGTQAAETVVTTNDNIGRLDALGFDGTDYAISSRIEFYVDNTVSANIVPGLILFRTANFSTGTLTTALTLDSTQKATFTGDVAFPVGTISSAGVGSAFTQWNTDNLRLDGNTLSSTDTNGNIILDPDGTGAIRLSGPTEMSLNILKFGSSNEASMFFDTGLVISPDTTTNLLTLGTATGTGSANMVLNKIAVGNSPTGNATTIAYINGVISGSGRGILNFDLTFTGAGNAAVVTKSVLTDQGSLAGSYTGAAYQAQIKGDTASHTGTTYYGMFIQAGLTTNFNVSSGNHNFYGGYFGVDVLGQGSGSISGGNFRRYGVFVPALTAIAGAPTTDVIMGGYFGSSINVPTNTKVIFDSTTTTLGTTYLLRSAANTRLEVYENATLVFDFDTAINKSETILGTLAGTSTTYAKVGGVIEVNMTSVATIANTTETDLQTFSIPANSMGTNGDSVEFEVVITTAANANTKRIKIKYGATTMYDSTALALNGSVVTARGRIIRTGAATQSYYVEVSSNSALLVATSGQGTAAETLSGAVTFKVTGQNGTASANDIVEQMTVVKYYPNK